MKAVRLFHDNGEWTQEGRDVSNEITSMLRAFYQRHCFSGVSPRELTGIICAEAVMEECTIMVLDRRKRDNQNKIT